MARLLASFGLRITILIWASSLLRKSATVWWSQPARQMISQSIRPGEALRTPEEQQLLRTNFGTAFFRKQRPNGSCALGLTKVKARHRFSAWHAKLQSAADPAGVLLKSCPGRSIFRSIVKNRDWAAASCGWAPIASASKAMKQMERTGTTPLPGTCAAESEACSITVSALPRLPQIRACPQYPA